MSRHYPLQWAQIQKAVSARRLAQTQLWVGTETAALHCLVQSFNQLIVCQGSGAAPCLDCSECKRILASTHPDIQWVKPEQGSFSIKIDQIRDLQTRVYVGPQRAKYKIIVIEEAHRLNTAAANALLKILEEPPSHALFVLIAQQVGTMLPTVLSRCQIHYFSSPVDSYTDNTLLLAGSYPEGSARFAFLQEAENLLDGLIAMIEGRTSARALAFVWIQAFAVDNLLWFLYLVYAQLHYMHVGIVQLQSGPALPQLSKLSSLLPSPVIFNQINLINAAVKQISHNRPLNDKLVLEGLLLALLQKEASRVN